MISEVDDLLLNVTTYSSNFQKELITSWKSAIIEGAVVVLCPVEVLSRRQTQHQHKHMAHRARAARQHGPPEPAAKSRSCGAPVSVHRSPLKLHCKTTPVSWITVEFNRHKY